MNFITPTWPAPNWIKAFTTTKNSWGEYSPQHSFILNANPSELITDPKFVTENNKLIELLNLPAPPIWVRQTHSSIALPATYENKEKIADATYSHEINHICAILTADCLPILIYDPDKPQVAAIHAGWKGLANGIIENTIQAMEIQRPNDTLIWFGPAIGPNNFEVGQEVADIFISKQPNLFSAFIPISDEKYLADIYTIAKIQLASLGINKIYGGEFCTFTQDDLFYSYRREKGQTGRMASLIWIDKTKDSS